MPSKSKSKSKPSSGGKPSKGAADRMRKSKPALAAEPLPELPKDDEEEELEKMLFGDAEGFRAGLEAVSAAPEESDDDEDMRDADEDEEGLKEIGEEAARDFAALNDDQLFFVDDTAPGGELAMRDEEPVGMELDTVDGEALAAAKPVWEDSDDERMAISLASQGRTRKLRNNEEDDVVSGREYAMRLRRQFERIYPTPEWALPEKPSKRQRTSETSDDDSSDDEGAADFTVSAPSLTALLSTTTALAAPKSNLRLRPEVLDIHRLTDGNIDHPSRSGIRSISFHPTHPLLLTSGYDSTLRLYHIDGKTNPAATTLHIKNSPLETASFLAPSGTRILAAGRRRYFHVWDLQTGKVERVSNVYGHRDVQRSMETLLPSPNGQYISLVGARGTVQILDANTCQWVCTATVEGTVSSVAWHPSSAQLIIANKVGEIFEFDLASKRVIGVWRDEGGVSTTTIAASNRFIAVGSASGVVNIYDRKVSFSGAPGKDQDPKPVRTIENLVTAVSVLRFSPDGQLLCVASTVKKDALRLVHLPSCTVYKNWPTDKTPLGKVTAVEWAKGVSGLWLAVGNEMGKVRMFEIRG